ncbi:MAG: DNA uptake protein ComE-like DNA-binding protein, partial [Candidatus Krumholzibacteriia bacterium]
MSDITTIGAVFGRSRKSFVGLFLTMILGIVPVLTGGLPGTAISATDHTDLMDLNSASLEEVLTLPIPENIARGIIDYRTYVRFFGNIYELREVDGVTPEYLALLKPLVSTMPPLESDPSLARLSASYRQVRNYLGQEGSNEGLVDEYLDRLRNPENLNDMDIWDLMSYQNVSPVDAANIIKSRDRLGSISGGRNLRGTQGLRYFAYRNLRDFVVYSEEEKAAESTRTVTGYVQTRYWETPFASGDDEITAGITEINSPLFSPGWMNKMRLNIKGGYQLGLLTSQEYGEANWNETTKGYAAVTDKVFGDFRLKSAVAGNFRVAYGLGLVMDNTDYIHFRKTGFG